MDCQLIKPLYIFLTAIVVSSCRPNIPERVNEYVLRNHLDERLEHGDTVTIDWSEIMGYPVDSVAYLGEYLNAYDISKFLSTEYYGPMVKDNHNRFIFFHDKEIIYEEDVSWYELCIFTPTKTGSFVNLTHVSFS